MSLQGIFNPIVKAYFENKYAGSGGSGGSAKVLQWGSSNNKKLPSVTIEDWSGTFYRIADFIGKDKLQESLFVLKQNGKLGGITISEDNGSLMDIEEDGVHMVAVIIQDVPFLFSIEGDNAGELFGQPDLQPGFFVNENTISNSDNEWPSLLVFGPVERTTV